MRTKGERLRELREAKGLSREQLAVRAGVHSRTVARIENDEGPSNIGTLRLLAITLGCDVTEFTDDDEPVGAAA